MYCWTQCPIIIISCYREEHRMQSWSSLKYQPSTLSMFTYSMEQSSPWEANQFSASQEIPHILWNPKVHYHIYKCPPPVPILSSTLPIQRQNGMDTFRMSRDKPAAFHSSQEVDLNSACRWSTKGRYRCHAKHCIVINEINRFTEISIATLRFMQIIKVIKTQRSCPTFFNITVILSILQVGFNQKRNVIHKWWHQNHYPSN